MKPKIQYDEKRGIGRIEFASHVTTVRGSREFCERFVAGLEHEADEDYRRAVKRGQDESEARKARDRVVREGVLHR